MELFGIGPLELFFILIIALVVLGPKDMVKSGRALGKLMRQVVNSDFWRSMNNLRYLPNQLMREAGLEENELREIREAMTIRTAPNEPQGMPSDDSQPGADLSDWTSPAQLTIDTPPKLPYEQEYDLSDWTSPPVPTIDPTQQPPNQEEQPPSRTNISKEGDLS